MLFYGLFACIIPWLVLRKTISPSRIRLAWLFGFGVTLAVAFYCWYAYLTSNMPKEAQATLSGGMFCAIILPLITIRSMKKIHSKNPKSIVLEITPNTKTERKNYFISHWQGEQSLTRSFWINWLFLSLLTFLLVDGFIDYFLNPRSESISLGAVLAICLVGIAISLAFAVWQTVGVLRAAYKQIQSGGNRWSAWLTVLIVAVSVFLGANAFVQKHFVDQRPYEQITHYQEDVRFLQNAGFSGDEIQGWSDKQSAIMLNAGFSQDEVDGYQGLKPLAHSNYGRIPTDKDFQNAASVILNGCDRPLYEKAVDRLKGLFADHAAHSSQDKLRLPDETPEAYLVRINQSKKPTSATPSFRDITENGRKCP